MLPGVEVAVNEVAVVPDPDGVNATDADCTPAVAAPIVGVLGGAGLVGVCDDASCRVDPDDDQLISPKIEKWVPPATHSWSVRLSPPTSLRAPVNWPCSLLFGSHTCAPLVPAYVHPPAASS